MLNAVIDHRDARRRAPRGRGKANPTRRELRSRPERHWCAYCEQPAETWDHVDPWSKSRDNSTDNLLPACEQCNVDKGDLPLIVFLVLTMPELPA